MALFTGCGTALITPFRNGEVDYPALDHLVETQLEAGVDALIAAGTTGEPATMTWEEHLNVIRRASGIFDHVVVCIMKNAGKQRHMFSTTERVELARKCVERFPNVEVTTFDGLVAEYAATFPEGAVIVKGLRAHTDFENEFQMALINRKLNPGLDTMFLTAEHQYMFMSSSVIRELSRYDVDLSDFLPEQIIPDVREKNHLIDEGGK